MKMQRHSRYYRFKAVHISNERKTFKKIPWDKRNLLINVERLISPMMSFNHRQSNEIKGNGPRIKRKSVKLVLPKTRNPQKMDPTN